MRDSFKADNSKGFQRPPLLHGQAKTWLRLLLVMTVPTLWLLAGIAFAR